MKELLNQLIIATAKNDYAEELYKNDPENEEYEKEFDRTYKEAWKIREAMANEIVKITKGEIDFKTAFKMTYKPELAYAINHFSL